MYHAGRCYRLGPEHSGTLATQCRHVAANYRFADCTSLCPPFFKCRPAQPGGPPVANVLSCGCPQMLSTES